LAGAPRHSGGAADGSLLDQPLLEQVRRAITRSQEKLEAT
jgi:hypothetical protein